MLICLWRSYKGIIFKLSLVLNQWLRSWLQISADHNLGLYISYVSHHWNMCRITFRIHFYKLTFSSGGEEWCWWCNHCFRPLHPSYFEWGIRTFFIHVGSEKICLNITSPYKYCNNIKLEMKTIIISLDCRNIECQYLSWWLGWLYE